MLHSTTNNNTTPINGKINGSFVNNNMAQQSSPAAAAGSTNGTAAASSITTVVQTTLLDTAMGPDKRIQERENLRQIIAQWNANRLDLFEISEPNEDLEFYGVMRFYFQDAGQKVATKCMRISSTASTSDVISNLIEKFRPDIRMLSVPEYALYEIHENGEERKLEDREMPLLVQLNWHKDDREGRFLLRRMDEKTYLPGFTTTNESSSSSNLLNRKLSKREKKEKKKREKKEKAAKGDKNKDSLAERLYTELPETSFTRSISNPEAVMRRRRQQKLEKKLQQFSQEGGPEAGGTLRIFGETINKDVPYKTILLSTRDTAAFAVKEILEKYGRDKEDPNQYCLVQMISPLPVNGDVNDATNGDPTNGDTGNIREYILDDDDCPLIIERSHVKARGILTFHIRLRPSDYQHRKRKKKPGQSNDDTLVDESTANGGKVLPYLMEVNPDGSELTRYPAPGNAPRRHYLHANAVTEVGREINLHNSKNTNRITLQMAAPNIQARHCMLNNVDGMVTVNPANREAEVYVNGTRVMETTVLKHGMLLRFGKSHTFRFVDEMAMRRHSQLSTGAIVGQHFQQQQQQIQQLDPLPEMTTNASYETTFNADGKVETAELAKPSSSESMQQQQQPYSTGSLQRNFHLNNHNNNHSPRSASRSSMNPPNGGPPDGTVLPTVHSNLNVAMMRGSTASVSSSMNSMPRKGDNILPAILEVWEEEEDKFLNIVIKKVDPNQVQFKLCITYTLYMVTRYRASTYFKPEIVPEQRADRLTDFCIKYARMIHQTIKDHLREQDYCAFWLANASELLHFLKNDRHLNVFTLDSQDILTDAIKLAFAGLVSLQQQEVCDALTTFAEDITSAESSESLPSTSKMLVMLSNSMHLLRRFRVNAALTIQLFSQMFHYINMSLYNMVIGTPERNFCTRHFGRQIKNSLHQILIWAEQQGLELAAECHLARILQTAQFLQSPKIVLDALEHNELPKKFDRINSIQFRALFEQFKPTSDEVPLTTEQIEKVITVARQEIDTNLREEGHEILLEEDPDSQLPFVMPGEGYSCDIVCGIPAGLLEFIQKARVCNLTIQHTALGYWNIYFINFNPDAMGPTEYTPNFTPMPMISDEHGKVPVGMKQLPVMSKTAPQLAPNGQLVTGQMGQFMPSNGSLGPMHSPLRSPMLPYGMLPGYAAAAAAANGGFIREPEVHVIKLQKSNNGVGLSIVAAQGMNQTQQGIYIKSVVKGGAADVDGRLEAGDQLLKVDGHSLIGVDQSRAAELMTQTGPIITLEVAKHGALYHGLGNLFAQAGNHLMNKAATMRPRYPLNGQEFNSMRINGPHMQHARMPLNHTASFPTYNTLPVNLYHEERPYQNIQLYQLNPRTGSPLNNQQMSPMMTAANNKIIQGTGTRSLHHGSHSSLQPPINSSEVVNSQSMLPPLARPVSALVTSREKEQLFTSSVAFTTPGTPTMVAPRQPTPSMMHSVSATNAPEFFKYPPTGQNYPTQGNLNSPQHRIDPRHMRQEAKIEEFREELRRRGDPHHTSPYIGSIPRGMPLTVNSMGTMPLQMSNNPLRPNHQRYASQQGLSNGGQFVSSQSAGQLARPQPGQMNQLTRSNMPPPPAPKPSRPTTSMSSAQPATVVSYRYGPSGYPPPPNSKSVNPNSATSLHGSGVASPSPWEREEKEKENQHKFQETKKSRDDEIKYLESLPYRNPKNEERLRSLILERDFQKRAEEHLEEDEEDEEIFERADNRERMLSMKQDLERTRQRRIEQRYGSEPSSQVKVNRTLEEQEERLKMLRLEEEAAQQAEKRLLQEARKRQEEDLHKPNASRGILKTNNINHSDNDVPPPLPNSPPPLESANQRLDRLILSTMPKDDLPDDYIHNSVLTKGGVLKNSNGENSTSHIGDKSVKKVSWNDNTSTAVLPHSDHSDELEQDEEEEEEEEEEEHQEDTFSLQDIDDVLGGPASSGGKADWNNYSVGSTPGVIGAQEVYNDPRQRIEARLKSNQKDISLDKVPEKLSFQEKLSMFHTASGSGNEETTNNGARSKMKVSKAQREIEGRESTPLNIVTNGDINSARQ